jgi:hypothetical protein
MHWAVIFGAENWLAFTETLEKTDQQPRRSE